MKKRIIAGSLLSALILSAATLAACDPRVEGSTPGGSTQQTSSQSTMATQTTAPVTSTQTEPQPTQSTPPASDHVHSLGEWEVYRPVGCTLPELSRRVCACGFYEEKETAQPDGLHRYDEAGQCSGCDRKVSVGLFYKLNTEGDAYTVIGIGSCEDTVVTIPESFNGKPVTAIRDLAFASIGNTPSTLQSITIPGTVTQIGKAAFAGCQMLTEIHVDPDSQFFACQESILYSKDLKTLLVYPGGKGEEAFTVPEHVQTIGDYAFAYSIKLKQVTLPDSVQYIGDGAFASSSLEKICFGAGVKTLGNQVFAGCRKLTAIEVDGGNPNYSSVDGVLMDADGGTLYVYPAGKTATSYRAPEGVQVIAPGAFYGCLGLQELQLPDSVTEISESAFFDCADLQRAYLGNGLVTIGREAFAWCTGLTQVDLGQKLETLEENAFMGCASLRELVLPQSLKKLCQGAISSCDSLETIQYAGTVRQWCLMEKDAGWDGMDGEYTLYCADMTHFCEGLQYVLTENDTYMVAGLGTCKDIVITVPALYRGLPVTTIAEGAFADSKVEQITLPYTITSIGANAFSGCKALQAITVAEDNPSYVSIDGVLLDKAGKTLLVYPQGKLDTQYTLPETVEAIGYRGFYDCDILVKLQLPAGITAIGQEAFYHCNSLQEIQYPGSAEDWAAMEKGELWNANSPKLQIHCSDGAVGQETWSVIGTMGGDNFTVDIPMVQQMDGTWRTVDALTLEAGDQLYCRLGGSWDQAFPEEPFRVEVSGTYFILLDPTTGIITLISAEV